ncbi:MAG: hypothetical protein ACRBM6_35120 [Geminicoccales bacterium]
MSKHTRPNQLYGSVQRRMEWVAKDQRYRLRQAWVERVLSLLEGDKLIMCAATKPLDDEVLIFECNFAAEIWDDPRIDYRIKQLANNEIKVAVVEHEHTVAGKTFKRNQIHVTF